VRSTQAVIARHDLSGIPGAESVRNKQLDRYTLRGQRKVDTQWKLCRLVRNIEKLAKYGNLI
jgi:hypothetical protein